MLLIAFSFAAVLGKLAYVMIAESSELGARAASQWMRDIPTRAVRGAILDRNGETLAYTETRYDIYIRPNAALDKPAAARLISEVLGTDYAATLEKISGRASEITVARGASKEQLLKLLSGGTGGIYYGESNLRRYTYGDFLTQVLGFTGYDGDGQTGLEAYYDKYLAGTDGAVLTSADLVGRETAEGTVYIPSVPGMTLTTTLDAGVQRIVEGAIDAAVAAFSPKAAACLVMDYTTGEIVALAEYPSFDLNSVPRDDVEKLFSYSKSSSVSTVYEPGSTFKILTAAAALDCGAAETTDRYYC